MEPLMNTVRILSDDTSLVLLALFGAVWLTSGVYAAFTLPAEERPRFFWYYVPAAIGGLGVAVAGDAISFYLFFSLMALSSWGLVTHGGTRENRRAGAIYLTLTAASEAFLLAALVILASGAGSLELTGIAEALPPHRAATVTLLVVGAVALKIGTMPAIGILPLTYSSAPTGAAAALAGASAKVGALALLRLLPLGQLPGVWADGVMLLGLLTAFVSAIVGLFTTTPRGVLGYSSSSQMGLILVAAGAALAEGAGAPLARSAIVVFAVHHGLAKSALMLGEDVVARLEGRAGTLARAALALPALALVGLPLTSGFAGKYALKDAVHALHGTVPEAVYALLPWTAVGTALLMLRFFALLKTTRHSRIPSPAISAWLLLLAGTAAAVWLLPGTGTAHARESAFSIAAAWAASWPALISAAIALVASRKRGLWRAPGMVPPGDVLLPAAVFLRGLDDALPSGQRAPERRVSALGRRLLEWLSHAEQRWIAWPVASAIFALLALGAILLGTR